MSNRQTAAVRLLAGDKEPVRLASTANLALAGLLTVDGVVSVAGDRILVKDQTNAVENGIYSASEGTWYRTPDAAATRMLIKGMKVAVQEGTVHGGDVWSLNTDRPDVGDDDIEWLLFLNTEVADEINAAREALIAEMDAIIATGLAAGKATQAEAEAGVSNVGWMTPLRTLQAINAFSDERTFATRAAAIAATISADVDFISTNAYDSSKTENSGATFQRVAAGTPFYDTWPTAGTVAGGSGYVNGTYYGVLLSGSATGTGIAATVFVSGGAVTSVDYATQPGNAYKVGDVLSCSNALLGGTGSGFTYTVTAVSDPVASFVNTVDSSRWQYVQSKGFIHINEFGAKPDFAGVDASATNNFTAIQAALFYAVRRNFSGPAEDNGGFAGDLVRGGAGSYMLLHPSNSLTLVVPNGVFLEGVTASSTTLKFSDSWFAATNGVSLGNPNAHFANFNSGLKNIRLFFKRGISAANATYVVYSNNTQDGGGLENVAIFTGQRGGIKYEIGYGGASTVKFHGLNVNVEGQNAAFRCEVGTTIVDCRHWSLGAPSSGTNNTVNAIELVGTGGMYNFEGIHMEGFPNGFSINLQTGNNPYASFKNVTGGLHLAYVFTLVSTNVPGNCSFERCQVNNGLATGLVSNGQPGGSHRVTNIEPKHGIVFFNP